MFWYIDVLYVYIKEYNVTVNECKNRLYADVNQNTKIFVGDYLTNNHNYEPKLWYNALSHIDEDHSKLSLEYRS